MCHIYSKICWQNLLTVAQSGHTGGFCDCKGSYLRLTTDTSFGLQQRLSRPTATTTTTTTTATTTTTTMRKYRREAPFVTKRFFVFENGRMIFYNCSCIVRYKLQNGKLQNEAIITRERRGRSFLLR